MNAYRHLLHKTGGSISRHDGNTPLFSSPGRETTIENSLTVAQRDTNASITLLTSVTGRITKLYFEKIEGLLVSHPFMTIGAAYRAAFHFLVTTQALAMIGTFEP